MPAMAVGDTRGHRFQRQQRRQPIAAGFVLLAHLALRPLARKLDRMPAGSETEAETAYKLRAVCRARQLRHLEHLRARRTRA
jgi:hypothetical protein